MDLLTVNLVGLLMLNCDRISYLIKVLDFCNVSLGLANKKTVTIQVADKEQGVVLGTTKSKKQNKPKLSVNKSVLKKELVPQDGQSCCQPGTKLYSYNQYHCLAIIFFWLLSFCKWFCSI